MHGYRRRGCRPAGNLHRDGVTQEYALSQNCPATVIPAGDKVRLSAGTKVFITQTLGGNITVRTDQGLFQIAKENAGLIEGYTAQEAAPAAPAGEFSEEAVWGALKTCFDPEIPVNIVDLGLVYDLAIEKAPEPQPAPAEETTPAEAANDQPARKGWWQRTITGKF